MNKTIALTCLLLVTAACGALGGPSPEERAAAERESRIAAAASAEERAAIAEVGFEEPAEEAESVEANLVHPPEAPVIEPVEASAEISAATHGPSRQSGLSRFELEIWNSEAFLREFTQSYVAETDIEPSVTLIERDDLMEVRELISANELDEALGLLDEYRDDEGASAVIDFTRANIHFTQDQLDEAAVALEVAVKKYPKFRRAWQNLGVTYFRLGEFELAAPALTEMIKLGGGTALTYGMLGFCYSSLEKDLAAESAFRMAILLDPATLDWRLGLARSLFRQKRFADAASLCDAMIALEPERADLWLLQANAFIGLGRPLDAAANYELVNRMGKATVDSLTNLGDIYVNEQLFGLAVECYLKAFEMDAEGGPDRALRAANVLTSNGALADTGVLIDGIKEIFAGILSDEETKALLKVEARVALAADAGEKEAKILEQIVALDPLDGEALLLLGQYYRRTRDIERSILFFERAAELEEFESDGKLGKAQVLVGERRYGEALPLLKRVQALDPRSDVEDYLRQVERAAANQGSRTP